MWKKFKEFAFKGNVIDLAVGVIIGTAFGKIVSSLVADIITPLIGLITKGRSLEEMFVLLGDVPAGINKEDIITREMAKEYGVATWNYGAFIQTIIDFFIIAFSIFLFVTLIAKAREKQEAKKKALEEAEKVEEAPKPTSEELLAEIRDLLKEKKD